MFPSTYSCIFVKIVTIIMTSACQHLELLVFMNTSELIEGGHANFACSHISQLSVSLQVVKSVDTPVLKPGKNVVLMTLPPQRPGSYVLGVLTGHIGHVILRSHTYCTTSAASSKGGPPDSDDYLSNEKPIRIVLEVVTIFLYFLLSFLRQN